MIMNSICYSLNNLLIEWFQLPVHPLDTFWQLVEELQDEKHIRSSSKIQTKNKILW